MFSITKEFRFEASHVLPHQGGKCARMHGHSWRMFVTFVGPVLSDEVPAAGMLADFGSVKGYVQPLVETHLDHWHLNETTGLANPTSEELARWLYYRIKERVPAWLGAMLYSVRVDETCTSSCTYWEH